MNIFKPLGDIFWLNPVASGAALGVKVGGLIGSNLVSGQKATANLADVFKAPASTPLIINQAPKTGFSALGIGFIEKNLIIVGVFALGAAYIFSKRVTINSKDFGRVAA